MQNRMINKKTEHSRIVKRWIMMLFLAAALSLSGCGGKEDDSLKELEVGETEDPQTEDPGEDAKETDQEKSKDREVAEETAVYVYVCGAVNAPGVYELKKDARVFEAIGLAGGLTEEASAESVNQARTVADGEQIYVPTVEEAQGAGVIEGIVTEGTDEKRININTAGKEELMTLTGIGEAKAQSILDYREEHGMFGSIEDLMKIEGIKEGVFNKIKEDIMI